MPPTFQRRSETTQAVSWVVVMTSAPGQFLPGGVTRYASSRFGSKEDAESLLATHLDLAPKRCVDVAEVVPSSKPPEIFRHCQGAEAQAINGYCPACRKLLTPADARAFARLKNKKIR